MQSLLPDNSEGIVLCSRLLPVMQRLRENCHTTDFRIQLRDGSVLNFWDIERCDEELVKVDYK